MAAKMGRKTMLRVANAVSDGVDPRDWSKLKSKEILLPLKWFRTAPSHRSRVERECRGGWR